MPNEIRPCTLWGETFDAMKVVSLNEERKESLEHHIRVCISTPHPANRYDSLCVVLSPHFMPPLEAFRIANNAIAEALNAPVLATEEVLKDLPSDAKVYTLVNHESNGIKTQMKCFLYWGLSLYWGLTDKKEGWMYREHDLNSLDGESYDYLVSKSDKLYADDHKTAEYLRQFTLNGVRIKEGG